MTADPAGHRPLDLVQSALLLAPVEHYGGGPSIEAL